MIFDNEKFEKLLEAKKFDDAKVMLTAAFTAEVSPAQEGALYTELAVAKMKLTNAVNRRYKAVLENVVAGLQEIRKAEKAADDKIDILKVRKNLA